MLKNFLLVGIGGAAGSVLRYAASLLISNKELPYATFIVNIIGSFVIGMIIAYSLKNSGFQNNWQLLLATGVCGGFTTFSAFTLENFQLLQAGKYFIAVGYTIISLLSGITAVWMGYLVFKN